MKKTLFFLVMSVFFLASVNRTFGQESGSDKDFKFTIKVNPLSALGGPFWIAVVPVTGEYKVVAEYAFTQKMSFQAGVSYIGPSVLINLDKIVTDTANVSGINTNGFKVSGMFKYYLSRDLQAPEGFYVAPHFSFAKATIASKDNADDNIGAQKMNINLCIGYQLITSGGFTLDVFTGMGFVQRKWDYEGESSGIFDLGKNKSSVSIPLGFSFGYAF